MNLKDLIERYKVLRIEKFDDKKILRKERYLSRRMRSILDDIATEFVEFIRDIPTWKFEFMDEIFKFGRKIGKECNLNLSDIEKLFNQVLNVYVQGGMLGCFVSGLYHDLIEEGEILTLDLRNYRGSVSGLGYRHERGILRLIGSKASFLGFYMKGGIVEVKGNVGNHLGRKMEDGRIIVKGNARDWIGECMKGGIIVVKGDVGNVIGEKMEGGEIVIEGNAGFWVGDGMRDGKIKIFGNVKSISFDRYGGKIYMWRGSWVELR